MNIYCVYFRITFEGEDGNITHSEEGMAFCEGELDRSSFERSIVVRYVREGDARVNFQVKNMRQTREQVPEDVR